MILTGDNVHTYSYHLVTRFAMCLWDTTITLFTSSPSLITLFSRAPFTTSLCS